MIRFNCNNKKFYIIKEFFRLCGFPMSICHPIPFIVFLVFSQVISSQIIIIKKYNIIICLLFSILYLSAVNLWNHYNDIVEDMLSSRVSPLVVNIFYRKIICLLSLIFYVISLFIVYIKSNILFFLPSMIMTLLYSDKYIMNNYRLKNHYITELLTYIIAVPLYTLTLWCFFSPVVTYRAMLLALSVTLLMLSGTFLKDIKDYTGDHLAGLKTLGVVCKQSILIILHYMMVYLYYISIIFGVFFRIYTTLTLIAILTIPLTTYSLINMLKSKWKINFKSVKYLKLSIISIISSLILFIISGFLSLA